MAAAESVRAADGHVPAGSYTPDRLDLALTGESRAADLVVYVHEIHHQGLNDSTAWGAALHVLSALGPRQRACFAPMLDACRLAHEAYATFAAVSIVAVHCDETESVLAHYPDYERLYRSLSKLAAAAAGPHRQYLLATALARVSMQTPVLNAMLGTEDLTIAAADLAPIDIPDGRWSWFIRAGRTLTERATEAADQRLAESLGSAALLADAPGRGTAAPTATEYDAHWAMWERAAYGVLAAALAEAGAVVLEFNGHMEPNVEIVERARRLDPELPLRAARPHSPAQDDAALSGAMVQFVRMNVVQPPRPGRLERRDIADLVPLSGDGELAGRDGGSLVHVRLPHRLLGSYRWQAEDAAVLEAAQAPIAALRLIESGVDESTIAHVLLPESAALQELTAARPRPTPVTIVGASCLIDSGWSGSWLPRFGKRGTWSSSSTSRPPGSLGRGCAAAIHPRERNPSCRHVGGVLGGGIVRCRRPDRVAAGRRRGHGQARPCPASRPRRSQPRYRTSARRRCGAAAHRRDLALAGNGVVLRPSRTRRRHAPTCHSSGLITSDASRVMAVLGSPEPRVPASQGTRPAVDHPKLRSMRWRKPRRASGSIGGKRPIPAIMRTALSGFANSVCVGQPRVMALLTPEERRVVVIQYGQCRTRAEKLMLAANYGLTIGQLYNLWSRSPRHSGPQACTRT